MIHSIRHDLLALASVILAAAAPVLLHAQQRPRGRDLGIPFPGTAGSLNAITDVPGVAVGHVTLINGEGRVGPGRGPVRSGVTAVAALRKYGRM